MVGVSTYQRSTEPEHQHPLGLSLGPHFTGGKNLPGEGIQPTQDRLQLRWTPHCSLKSTGRTATLSWAGEQQTGNCGYGDRTKGCGKELQDVVMGHMWLSE